MIVFGELMRVNPVILLVSAGVIVVLSIVVGPIRAYAHWRRVEVVMATKLARDSAIGAYVVTWIALILVLLHGTGIMVWKVGK